MMTAETKTVQEYLKDFFRSLGSMLESIRDAMLRWFDHPLLREKINAAEFQLEALVPRQDKRLGFIPLAIGIIIIFLVMGQGVLNWLVMAAALILTGVIIFGHADNTGET